MSSSERYAELYTSARNWAEAEAEACGEGPLPDWQPPFQTALALAGGSGADAETVQRLASESWQRMRPFWR